MTVTDNDRVKKSIEKFISWFYIPSVKKLIPYKLFKYIVCGGLNMCFDLAFFSFLYNIVFKKENVELGFIVLSPYIAAFLIVFPITFLSGYWLMNNIAFQGSALRNRTKLSRYFLVVCMNVGINYIGLKFFVEYLHFYPTAAKFSTTLICTLFSYISQRYFTFYKRKERRSQ